MIPRMERKVLWVLSRGKAGGNLNDVEVGGRPQHVLRTRHLYTGCRPWLLQMLIPMSEDSVLAGLDSQDLVSKSKCKNTQTSNY